VSTQLSSGQAPVIGAKEVAAAALVAAAHPSSTIMQSQQSQLQPQHRKESTNGRGNTEDLYDASTDELQEPSPKGEAEVSADDEQIAIAEQDDDPPPPPQASPHLQPKDDELVKESSKDVPMADPPSEDPMQIDQSGDGQVQHAAASQAEQSVRSSAASSSSEAVSHTASAHLCARRSHIQLSLLHRSCP
jgi:hypothetical protein